MPDRALPVDDPDGWDVLHRPGSSDAHWSTDNVGEAAPGVHTPLNWSMWGPTGDGMPRGIAHAMGAFSGEDLRTFPPVVRPFYGRVAMRMEYLAVVGDRMPGTSGPDAVGNLFGRVPETMAFAPTRRRYPVVARKVPLRMLNATKDVRAMAQATDAWWRAAVPRFGTLTAEQARAQLREGYERFDANLFTHSLALLAVVQPLLIELTKLVEASGIEDGGVLSGSGGAEMAIIGDIWKASRDELRLEDVLANHGFHGPFEGEVMSRVWREEPAPLARMIAEYRGRPDSEDPALRDAAAQRRLPEVQREVLAALPAARRPAARLVMRLAARTIPLRGVGKRAFLQALDVTRGSARRLGELHVEAGHLDLVDDTFYLTLDELTAPQLPDRARERVAFRRARRTEYQELVIPGSWRGVPEPTRVQAEADVSDETLTGIGASAGVVEGVVRVVLDPTFADVEDDEILVTPTTDPSWASIMFLSSALVVDIGGELSHAAVVARELGIPCVVNTRTGSRVLRTGDRVRVDGKAGTVEILERAAAEPAPAPAPGG